MHTSRCQKSKAPIGECRCECGGLKHGQKYWAFCKCWQFEAASVDNELVVRALASEHKAEHPDHEVWFGYGNQYGRDHEVVDGTMFQEKRAEAENTSLTVGTPSC